jgi:hypothetical protein
MRRQVANGSKPARRSRLQPNGRVAQVPCRGRGPDGGAPCERAKARSPKDDCRTGLLQPRKAEHARSMLSRTRHDPEGRPPIARAIPRAPATACSRIRAQGGTDYLPANAGRKAKRHGAPVGDAEGLRLRPVRSHRWTIPTRNFHASCICPSPRQQATQAAPDGDRRDVPGTLTGAALIGRLTARTVPRLPTDGGTRAQRRRRQDSIRQI